MALFDNLVAYWKADESAGPTVDDFTATNADGTITGSVALGAAKINNGLTFTNGAGNYVNVPDQASIRLWTSSSIRFWVYLTSYANGVILSKFGAFPAGFRCEAIGSHLYISEGGSNKIDLGTWVTTGSWHMVTLTVDGSNVMRAYVDGVARDVTPATGYFWLDEAQPWRFGAPTASFYGSGTAAFNGKLDEIALWDGKVLSQLEITEDYNAGAGTQYLPDTGFGIDAILDGTIYQREPDLHEKRVTFTGTYSTAAPASAQIQVLRHGTATVVQAYTELSDFTAASGVWSGVLVVPENAGYWYNVQAKSYNSAGTLLATSGQSTTKIAVGILIVELGQSNGHKQFEPFTSPTPNPLTRLFNGSAWVDVAGNGAIMHSDKLQLTTGLIVGITNSAVSGSALGTDVGSGSWGSLTVGQPYPLAAIRLAAMGGDCEVIGWTQGEADTITPTTTTEYKAAAALLYSRFRALTGRTQEQLAFVSWMLGPIDDGTFAAVSGIRQAHDEMRNIRGMRFGGTGIDGVLVDEFHFGQAYYERMGRRRAQTELHLLGYEPFDATGPIVARAWMEGARDIYIECNLAFGAKLTEVDGTVDTTALTGFRVSQNKFVTMKTISVAEIYGRDLLHVRLSADVADGLVQIDYLQGEQPTTTTIVYDDTRPQGDTRGLPLLPFPALSVSRLSADIAEIENQSGTTFPTNQTRIPKSRTWTLIQTGDEGLVGEKAIGLKIGNAKTFAVDFANDLGVNGQITTIDEVVIIEGEADGVTFDEEWQGVDGSLAKLEITAIAADRYFIAVTVSYDDNDGGGSATGIVELNVTAVE